MTRVTITFDYDENFVGKLIGGVIDYIMEILMEFGNNIEITKSEEKE